MVNLIKAVRTFFYGVLKRYYQKGYTQITIPTTNYKFLISDDLRWAYSGGDYYEQNVIYFFDQVVKNYRNPVIIDAGANCGYYSIRYSNRCKQVFSFEPVSDTYRILRRNIRKNSIHNIIAFKSGLSDKTQERTINLYSSSGNNSLFKRNIPEEHPLKKIGEETIKLDSIDELIAYGKIGIPDIIKIDVEGAELDVLKGAIKTITSNRPTILLEYSESTSIDAGYSKELLLTALNLTNYKIYGIPEDENNFNIIHEDDLNKHKLGNLIFSPVESGLNL